jgi:hypothetical protein
VQTAVEKVNETKVPPAPPSPPAPSSLLIPFFSNWKS